MFDLPTIKDLTLSTLVILIISKLLEYDMYWKLNISFKSFSPPHVLPPSCCYESIKYMLYCAASINLITVFLQSPYLLHLDCTNAYAMCPLCIKHVNTVTIDGFNDKQSYLQEHVEYLTMIYSSTIKKLEDYMMSCRHKSIESIDEILVVVWE